MPVIKSVRKLVKIRYMEKKLILANYSNHKLLLVVLFISFSPAFIILGIRDKAILRHTLIELASNSQQPNSCSGRYIYIQDPPSRFNRDLLDHCETTFTTWTDSNTCPYLANLGIGRRLQDRQGILLNGCWFSTNLYLLSVIFHNRMQKYKCLTNDSSLASAIYVPYYAGIDASRYLWSQNLSLRDESALEFVKWLRQTPEWQKMWGRDHFIVSGRTAWDLRREWDGELAWGTQLRLLPESVNMSMLSVESSIWNNDHAIPYPTSFHPSNDSQVFQWQEKIRKRKRQYLFSFAGNQRPNNPKTLRAKVIEECRSANNLCKLLGCDYGPNGAVSCNNPIKVMWLFQNSVFCLQPRGDSFTRRSFFDSIVAGCIPVLFHPGSAYLQYKWHLPEDHNKYSVYIPMENEDDWVPGRVSETLLRIPEHRVKAMREEVIRLVPKVIYADPRSKLETLEDAFDVAVNGILERIERVTSEIEEGKDPSIGFEERDDSRYNISRFAGRPLSEG